MRKLTPWLNGDLKPIRCGVYQRKYWDRIAFCLWDGRMWHISWSTPDRAEKSMLISDIQNQPWRGLASNPKSKGKK